MSKTEVALTPATKLLWEQRHQTIKNQEMAEAFLINKVTVQPFSRHRELKPRKGYGKRRIKAAHKAFFKELANDQLQARP